MMVSWNNEAERNIPRIGRVCCVGEKVLQGSTNLRRDSILLLGGPEELGLVTGQDGVEVSHQGCRELAAQGGSTTTSIKNSRNNLAPAMENCSHSILEREEAAPGPSRIPGMVLQSTQQSCNFQEVKGRHDSPALQGGAELVQLVVQEADAEGARVESSPNHFSLVVVERLKLVDTQG